MCKWAEFGTFNDIFWGGGGVWPLLIGYFTRAGLKETTEKLVKKKLEGKDKLTPWEEFLEKKKEKKKQKKSQRKQVKTASSRRSETVLAVF